MAGVKKNFVYNMILVVGNYLFPLLVYPYISRVLGADNIGMYSYTDGIIDYFILFASLGIIPFGVREIARVKNDSQKASQVYSTLLALNVILTVVAVVVLIVTVNMIPKLESYRQFLYIGISKIVFSSLLVEWLFQGLSEFKYITIRSIAVRSLFVVSVFCFVRDSSDAPVYYILLCLSIAFNALFNLYQSGKYVHFSLKNIDFRLIMVPVLSFGFYKILTSMYTSFNIVYLGSVTDDTQTGYYYTATKLYGIIMSVITAFTTVMVPKVSEMLEDGQIERLREIALKSFEVIFVLTLPVIVLSCFYAPFIIDLISGKGYEGAILPFRIVMVLLLVISVEQVLVMQFLMALKDSRCILVLCVVGAIVGIALNILLVGRLKATGSAISWMVSEIAVMFTAIHFFQKHYAISFPYRLFVRELLLSIPYTVICLSFSRLASVYIIAAVFLMSVWFVVSNVIIQKDSVVANLVVMMVNRIKNGRI